MPLDQDVTETLTRFEERVYEIVNKRLEENPDDIIAIYSTRLFNHLISILALMAVDKFTIPPDPSNPYVIIDSRHVRRFLKIVVKPEENKARISYEGMFRELVDPTLDYLVRDFMTPESRQLEEKLETFIKSWNEREGLVSRNTIYQNFTPRLSSKKLNELLKALVDAGRLRVFKKRGSRGTYLWHVEAGEPPTGSVFVEVRF